MSENSIPQVALIAAELRAIADALDALAGTSLNQLWVTLQIQPDGADDDEKKVATIDAVGQAVVGKAGTVQEMTNSRSYHHNASGRRGPVSFSVFSSVTSPAEREGLAEVARLRAEIDELKARRLELGPNRDPDWYIAQQGADAAMHRMDES